MTYYNVRREHLRAGDVIQQSAIVTFWNTKQQSGIMQTWRLINEVTEIYDERGADLWLAENVRTGEQRVIHIGKSNRYMTVVGGRAFDDVRRGLGQIIDRGHFRQYVPKGVQL